MININVVNINVINRNVVNINVVKQDAPDEATKANSLALRLSEALKDRENVKVARSSRMAEIRLRDLDDSVTVEDVVQAISEVCKCGSSKVSAGAIKRAPNGLGTA